MGSLDIKKELKKLDKDQIIDLVADLYKNHKPVKEFLDFYVNPNEKELFEKYRDKVFEAFYPKRSYNYSLKKGKQAISDFKKLAPSAELLANLMLFYVETGLKFTLDFGDMDEEYYSSLVKTYNQALSLMYQEGILDQFADRAAKVVSESSGMGWGLYDDLFDAYSEFYQQ